MPTEPASPPGRAAFRLPKRSSDPDSTSPPRDPRHGLGICRGRVSL